METDKNGMRNIWFFVGLILVAIGFIVIVAGIYDLFFPTNNATKLANLHTNLWWGGIIFITGIIYIAKNKNKFISI